MQSLPSVLSGSRCGRRCTSRECCRYAVQPASLPGWLMTVMCDTGLSALEEDDGLIVHPEVQASILETCRAAKLLATEGQHQPSADKASTHSSPVAKGPQPITDTAAVVSNAVNDIAMTECEDTSSRSVISNDCQAPSGSSHKMDDSPTKRQVSLSAGAVVALGGCGAAETSGKALMEGKAASKRPRNAYAAVTLGGCGSAEDFNAAKALLEAKGAARRVRSARENFTAQQEQGLEECFEGQRLAEDLFSSHDRDARTSSAAPR